MHRLLLPFVVLFCAVLLGGVATQDAGSAAPAGPCGLRLAAAAGGELAFQIPARGTAERRLLRGAILRCALRRRDGSLFARLLSDRRQRVLAVAFFRRNGTLRRSTGAVYAQTPSDTGAAVKCGSGSSHPIGPRVWTSPRNWQIGSTPSGFNRAKVIQALQAAMNQWTKNVNHCGLADKAGPPMNYAGETNRKAGQDGVSVVDWASLQNDQDCKGALACTVTAYDAAGNPVESDTRFNTFYKWSLSGSANAYDIQAVAAHEFGHILQLDHVQGKGDETNIMWPYLTEGDISGRKLGKGDANWNNSNY